MSTSQPASCATAAFADAPRFATTIVIARQGKGYLTAIAFDANQPMGNSTCVSCGECMVSCPTGALTNKSELGSGSLYPEDTPNVYSVETEELLALPVFKNVSGTFLELNHGSVVKRRV